MLIQGDITMLKRYMHGELAPDVAKNQITTSNRCNSKVKRRATSGDGNDAKIKSKSK